MLHLAAQRGNLPVVEYLVCADNKYNINHSDNRGRTVLHYGVENKRACDTITTLISHGADILVRDCHGRSALHHAAKIGNLSAIEALMTFGMMNELHAADCFGMTPLQIAAHHKAHAVLAFLSKLESRQEGTQPTGLDLTEYSDMSAMETDSLLETALPTLEPSRYAVLPAGPRQDSLRVVKGWKSLSRTWQPPQWQTSDLNIYCCVIKYLAVVVVIRMFFVFLL